jgi:2-polyprenyl-6-methoxyphenol hydroxylase-like FAD-dependent oxidoreductase
VTAEVDVLVAGGRIAGCLTAIGLAARGVSVRLLESKDFPSDTLSTHFFRGDGLVRSLDEVGVLDEVLATGAPPLSCEYFSVDGNPFEKGPPQEPGRIGYCLSVRRSTLDAILAGGQPRLGSTFVPGPRSLTSCPATCARVSRTNVALSTVHGWWSAPTVDALP